ncbi:lactate utilization protein B [Hyperthermus butylicus]|uniref:LUD domain-containing protein n=1 Tax=Hyperthermus butylicus TaxID=54248 RepID=UPI00064E6122
MLDDETFQRGLRTGVRNAEGRFLKILAEHPELEQLARMVEKAKKEVISKIDYYIDMAMKSLERVHARAYLVHTAEEARETVLRIVGSRKLVIFSKSMVAEELKLREALEEAGNEVWETDMGELLIQLSGGKPMHTTAPAIHMSRFEAAKLLSKKLGIRLSENPTPEEIVSAVRDILRDKFVRADVGISGGNALAADSGSIVLVENEGNIRLVTGLPPVHIAIMGVEKIVPTLQHALAAAIVQAAWAGLYPPTYINVISGPSSTSDIERKRVYGAHGPREVHVVLVDNGRVRAARHEVLSEQLKCIRCGRCQWECPVWQQTANVWGGPAYGGPMGIGWTAITLGVKEAAELSMLCLSCGRCDEVCPVRVPLSSIIRWLKRQYASSLDKG